MHKMLWIMVSIFAASFAPSANAQTMDWRAFEEPFVTSAHATTSTGRRLTTLLVENLPCRVTCTAMASLAPISA
jgi:hypothetical protein